tara:strand:- start:187 stop:597 length:411 start_codon:yes stop_codon:yes gene_type:complete
MNEKISWDSSLIKKFSSSNHLKLLNQLKIEVIKYPLNKKKDSPKKVIKDNYKDDKPNQIATKDSGSSFSKRTNITKETNSNQSTISFNNSKNFSIYKNLNNDSSKDKNEKLLINEKKLNENKSVTFNERLNKIDMK